MSFQTMSPIMIRTEPCNVCNKKVNLSIDDEELNPDVTGLDLFIDNHGIQNDPPHSRLLYIDKEGSVRSSKVISKFTKTIK